MSSPQEGALPRRPFRLLELMDSRIELAQVGSGTESRFQSAVDDKRRGLAARGSQYFCKLLHFLQGLRAQLVERFAMERQIHDSGRQAPRNIFALITFHARCFR